MNWIKVSILVALLTSLFACKSKSNKNSESVPAKSLTKPAQLDVRMNDADSLVMVFYNDPFTADSLRYTRYYTQYQTTDTEIIQAVLGNTALDFSRLDKTKPCRSEGKVWMFTKGKIFQTIYFAYTKDTCQFIYLIKDGFFYYMPIEPRLAAILKRIKGLAINPDNPGG